MGIIRDGYDWWNKFVIIIITIIIIKQHTGCGVMGWDVMGMIWDYYDWCNTLSHYKKNNSKAEYGMGWDGIILDGNNRGWLWLLE